jgi:hypothetical protein
VTGARRRRGGLLALALLAAVAATPAGALLPAGSPFAAATAAAAAPALTMTADTRYTVDPLKRRVHVALALSATNHRHDTKTHRYYFDRAFLAVQPGTTAFKVTSPDAKPTVHVERKAKAYTLLRIDFGKRLPAGATRRFRLTFDIADPGGAPTRTTRIGTTLVSFAAWGFGTTDTPGGSVTVVFPAGFNVDVDSTAFDPPTTDAAGSILYTTGSLTDPLDFFAFFVADRPGAFSETTLQIPLDGRTVPVILRSWPDDPAWAKRVGSLLKRGLPALARDIGLPWTVERPLIVSEALSRDATGFAGRYDPPAGEIQIAYYAPSFVVLREAAHVWFDGTLLADRWASEAFASYYAVRAAKTVGEKSVKGPALTPALEAARVPLNAWAAPGTTYGAASATVELAESAAALKLANLIGARAGAAGLTAVWQAIRDQRAAYQATGPRATLETTDTVPDWRGLLDLFEEKTPATYDDLWTAWVVRPTDEPLLAARGVARARYVAIAARADPWLLPRVVRDSLRAWQFDQATELLDRATTALDDRDAVEDAAVGASLTPPATMQTDFEGPRGFAAASAEAEAELAAITAFREAVATRSEQPGLLAAIGLWNSDPNAAIRRAIDAFSSGDLQASVESSAFAKRVWSSAEEIGRNRILAAGASLAAVALGLWLLIRWYRDRGVRRRSVVVGQG